MCVILFAALEWLPSRAASQTLASLIRAMCCSPGVVALRLRGTTSCCKHENRAEGRARAVMTPNASIMLKVEQWEGEASLLSLAPHPLIAYEPCAVPQPPREIAGRGRSNIGEQLV